MYALTLSSRINSFQPWALRTSSGRYGTTKHHRDSVPKVVGHGHGVRRTERHSFDHELPLHAFCRKNGHNVIFGPVANLAVGVDRRVAVAGDSDGDGLDVVLL